MLRKDGQQFQEQEYNMSRVDEDLQGYYICGQCETKIFHLLSDEPTIPCPECGWNHKDRKKYIIPPKIKLDLSQY